MANFEYLLCKLSDAIVHFLCGKNRKGQRPKVTTTCVVRGRQQPKKETVFVRRFWGIFHWRDEYIASTTIVPPKRSKHGKNWSVLEGLKIWKESWRIIQKRIYLLWLCPKIFLCTCCWVLLTFHRACFGVPRSITVLLPPPPISIWPQKIDFNMFDICHTTHRGIASSPNATKKCVDWLPDV